MRVFLPFLALLWRHKLWVFLGFLLSLVTLLAGVALLALSGWFISAAAFAGLSASTALVFNYFLPAAGVRFFALCRIAARYGERVFNHQATFHILTRLRVWLFCILTPLSPLQIQRFSSGDLLARMVSDIDALDQLYLRGVSPILCAVLVSLAVAGLLGWFDPATAWAALSVMAICLVIVPLIAALLGRGPGRRAVEQSAVLKVQMVESIQGLAECLVYGAWSRRLAVIARLSGQWLASQKRLALLQGLSMALITLFTGVAVCWVLFLGVPMVAAQHLSGALLALMVLAVIAGFEAIVAVPLAFEQFGRIHAAAKRLLAVAKTQPAVQFSDQGAVPQNNEIIFKAVDFAYIPEMPVLKNVNWHIRAGEKLALVGETGSGKSSLAHLLVRFAEPDAGAIEVGGVSLVDMSEVDLRRHITLVSQRPHCFNASLRDNLLLAKPDATDDELKHALATVQLSPLLAQLDAGLDAWMGEAGMRLSGGQLRRLGIARALLHDAPIVILDEPFDGIDAVVEQQLITNLQKWFQDRTVIIICHHLPETLLLDRVISMDQWQNG